MRLSLPRQVDGQQVAPGERGRGGRLCPARPLLPSRRAHSRANDPGVPTSVPRALKCCLNLATFDRGDGGTGGLNVAETPLALVYYSYVCRTFRVGGGGGGQKPEREKYVKLTTTVFFPSHFK